MNKRVLGLSKLVLTFEEALSICELILLKVGGRGGKDAVISGLANLEASKPAVKQRLDEVYNLILVFRTSSKRDEVILMEDVFVSPWTKGLPVPNPVVT